MNAFNTAQVADQAAHQGAYQGANRFSQRRTRLGFAAAALCTTLVLFQSVAMLASPSIEPAVQVAAVKAAPAAPTAVAQADDNWSRNFANPVPATHAEKGPLQVAGLSAARANLR
jgi:hypothetical protein